MKVPKGMRIETIILRERSLWPDNRLLLECPKSRCDKNYWNAKTVLRAPDVLANSQRFIVANALQGDLNCERRKESCKCTVCSEIKQVCAQCKERQENGCEECDSLPPKCDTEGWSASFPSLILDDYQPDFKAQRFEIEERIEAHQHHCQSDSLLPKIPLWAQSHWIFLVSYPYGTTENFLWYNTPLFGVIKIL